MEGSNIQFVGAPCLQHSNYTFYKAFKYPSHNRSKILEIGDFFFLKILHEFPICIGEIELLWEDKASGQYLSSLRLYFRPEHTPKGRREKNGQDEVVALGERVILKLDELVPLIEEDIKWDYGSCSPCSSTKSRVSVEKNSKANGTGRSDTEENKISADVLKAKTTVNDNGAIIKNGEVQNEENGIGGSSDICSGAANIAVMNFPRYCRYRAMCRRLEGCENEFLHLAVVIAIGGYSSRKPGCKVMFCMRTFFQPEIDDWDLRMDHMLPTLKTKKMKKTKVKKDSTNDSDSTEEMFANIVPSVTSSSRPRRSTEPGDVNDDNVSTHEQAFLIGLHKYMHDAKMPIGRIPSLGFKQIDLYYFFKQADKLGGYDAITNKRMWKHLYDKLGGNSTNTSAATCTRKHYERLLLPYERHLRKMKAKKDKKHGHHGAKHKEKKTNSESLLSDDDISLERDRQKTSEHSSYQSADTEVLEIPVVRQKTVGANGSNNNKSSSKLNSGLANPSHMAGFPPGYELPALDGLNFTQLEQLQQQAMSSGDPAAAAAYANMLYQSGYLMPLLQPHMLQSQWGPLLMGHPGTHPSTSTSSSDPVVKKVNQKDSKPAHLSSSPSPSPSSSTSKHPSSAHHNYPPLNQNKSSNSGSNSSQNGAKPAHSNTPYVPSPYLLSDHIQSGPTHARHRKSRSHTNSLGAGSASRQLASILHPKPTGHRDQPSSLPPAPTSLYLDPVHQNPFSFPVQSLSGSPPNAHSSSRKRTYPFDNPGVFPSPDIILDQIKSSAGLPPRGNAPTSVHTNCRQKFDNPRDILQHTQQSFLASQSSRGPSSGPKPNQQYNKYGAASSSSNSNRLLSQGNKSKNGSKKSQGAATAYSPSTNRRAGQVPLQSSHQVRQASNGYLTSQHANKVSPGLPDQSAASTSSKEGKLTSALFGTQFTAVPRSTKPSDLGPAFDPSILASVSSSSLSPSAAVAAATLSLNPHLHPAFMNPFGLPGSNNGSTNNPGSAAALVSPSNSVANNNHLASQLQMLAGAYGTTPAQLAAYEEMIRQNGYAGLVFPGMPPSPHLPRSVPVPSGIGQQTKGAKKN